MLIYRLSKKEYIDDLSGTGARLYGGRWNPKGYAILYTSENKSLAALEVLVHLDQRSIPERLQIITLYIPDELVQSYDQNEFNRIIKLPGSAEEFQKEGKKWILSGQSLGLQVPSILIPGEHNILINPMHPSFHQLKIERVEEFNYDQRLFVL